MRGIDGNFINAQGDATARMQLAYQTEQNRQQMKAQMEAADALRKLREEVVETEKLDSSRVPKLVSDNEGSNSGAFLGQEPKEGNASKGDSSKEDGAENLETVLRTHIDIRA